MREAIKAALFSALIFPGTGHFVLRRYQRGLIFFVPTLAGMIVFVYWVLNKTNAIAGQIESGQLAPDIAAISNQISASSGGTDMLMLNMTTWLMLLFWIGSIIDSFRLGKTSDQVNSK